MSHLPRDFRQPGCRGCDAVLVVHLERSLPALGKPFAGLREVLSPIEKPRQVLLRLRQSLRALTRSYVLNGSLVAPQSHIVIPLVLVRLPNDQKHGAGLFPISSGLIEPERVLGIL